MFDMNLFYSLCEKYGVELSDAYDKPMLRVGEDVKSISASDLKSIFGRQEITFSYGAHESKIVETEHESYEAEDCSHVSICSQCYFDINYTARDDAGCFATN